MAAPAEMRSPATALQSGDRAEGNRNEAFLTIATPEPEENFPALYLARRHGLALPVARTIAALANLARTLS